MTSRVLDADAQRRIHELATTGMKVGRIAKTIGANKNTVYRYMLNVGLAKSKRPARGGAYLRRGKPVRFYSEAEDAFIEKLRTDRVTLSAIAEAIKKEFGHVRPIHSISTRLMMLASRDDEAEASA